MYPLCIRVPISIPQVTSYTEGDLVLLESGAILMHLLEKHDAIGLRLTPTVGSRERANFIKFMFYASSTADHLLFSSYRYFLITLLSMRNLLQK